MKNIIQKSIAAIVILAMALTLVIPPIKTQAKAAPKLNKTKVTISVKKSYRLKVIGTAKKVEWKSSNKKVAAVSKNGKVTGKKRGSAVITAKVNKKTYKCKVTVTEPKPTLNKTHVTLTITNQKTKPAVQLTVKNIAGKKVKWETSSKKIAAVSKNGKVVAKKKGAAVITAKIEGNKTLRCKVTVKDNRKAVTNPTPNPPAETECQHTWVEGTEVVGTGLACTCGKIFDNEEQWMKHCDTLIENGLPTYGVGTYYKTNTYLYCSKCKKRK